MFTRSTARLFLLALLACIGLWPATASARPHVPYKVGKATMRAAKAAARVANTPVRRCARFTADLHGSNTIRYCNGNACK